MGFKDYCKNSEKINDNEARDNTKKIEDLYEKYKDKNEDELLNELLKNVEKQKKEGSFNYQGLINTIDKISPFLSKEQNLRIKEILENIK